MIIRIKVCMSKIMCMPIKIGVDTYVTYSNCRTLTMISGFSFYFSIDIIAPKAKQNRLLLPSLFG